MNSQFSNLKVTQRKYGRIVQCFVYKCMLTLEPRCILVEVVFIISEELYLIAKYGFNNFVCFINITENHHFALIYLLGITRLRFIQSTAQEPSMYAEKCSSKYEETENTRKYLGVFKLFWSMEK